MRRVATAVLAIALVLALLAPASALAHAQLEGTSPERGAVVEKEPAAVVFRFDEPVEGNFGAVRVYDADGSRVDEGDAFHPGGEGPRLGVHLKPGLPDGSYTATYRVVSADGHIVSSGFVFSIGKAGKAPKETVSQLTAGSGSGPVTETAFGLARGLQYTAIALAVGGLAFLLLAWLPALAAIGGEGERWSAASRAFSTRLRRLLLLAAALGAISAAAGVVLEGAEAAGVSGFSALKETIVRETLETKFGTVLGPGDASPGSSLACSSRWRCAPQASGDRSGHSSRSSRPPWPSSSSCRRSRATAAPSHRSPCSSRSTSSTSPPWRSGSAVWQRCSSSPREAPASSRPAIAAGCSRRRSPASRRWL